MAIKARDDVTLASITDVSYTRRYYLLQSSTLNPPAAPIVNPAPSPWVTTEPSYTEGSTNSLYTVDLTVFTDASFDYSQVSKSSSYEAAKAAYNKAVAAQSAASAAQTTANGKNAVFRQDNAPSTTGRKLGDTWFDTNDGNRIYTWNGSAWTSTQLGANGIADNSIGSSKIVDGSVGSTELASAVNSSISTAQTTAANAQTAANTAQSAADATQAAVDALRASARNLLAGTDVEFTNTYPSSGYSDKWSAHTIDPATDSEYVLTFEASSTVDGDTIFCYFYNPNTTTSVESSTGFTSTATSGDGSAKVELTTTPQRYWVKWKQSATTTTKYVIVGRCMVGSGTGTVTIRQPMLVAGNIPADWTPAPDDISDDIDAAQAAADAAQDAADAAQSAANNAQSVATAAKNAATAAQTTADGKNKITRSTSAASGAGVAGDQWWQYSGSEVVGFWIHNGTSWVSQTLTDSVITHLNAGTITAGTLSADRIGAASITAAKMVSGTITAASGIIADAAITNAKIADATIQNAKIATLDAAKITTGTLSADRIGANSITTAKIAADAVTANEIAANSITATNGIVQSLDAGKITTGYLGADRIASHSITAAKLVSGTITASSGVIADLAITNAMIANGAIQNAKIANLDAGKITTGTLNAARIAANSITADKLNANAFTGQTFSGGLFTVGGQANMPKGVFGPASENLSQPGDRFGLYLTTPNNNSGNAFLEVEPTGPSLTFNDSSNNESFYVDSNGNIRIKNLTDGGNIDLTKLSTQKWTWSSGSSSALKVKFTSSSWSPWAFFREADNGITVPVLSGVTSETGRFRISSGFEFRSATNIDYAIMKMQWGFYTADPSTNDRTDITHNLLSNLGRGQCAGPAITGLRSGYGAEVFSATPGETYWVTPFYSQMILANGVTAGFNRFWVMIEPI